MINIKSTGEGKGLLKCQGIEVTDEQGNKVKQVMGIKIDMQPPEIVRATVKVGVGKLELYAKETMIYIDNKGNQYKRWIPARFEGDNE